MLKIGKYDVIEPQKETLIKAYLKSGMYVGGDINHDFEETIDYTNQLMPFVRKLYRYFCKKVKLVLQQPEKYPEYVEICKSIYSDKTLAPNLITDNKLIQMGSLDMYDATNHLIPYLFFDSFPEYIKRGGPTWLEIIMSNYHVDERLYVNLKAKNTIPFVNELIKKTFKDKVPIFKFSTEYRPDQLVIYTEANDTERIIDVLESIKLEHPELCEGTENLNINFGNINGWIGYGEDTEDKTESFSSQRDFMVTEFINILKSKKIFPAPNNRIKDIAVTKEMIEIFDRCAKKYNINPDHFILNYNSVRNPNINEKLSD